MDYTDDGCMNTFCIGAAKPHEHAVGGVPLI
jgi:hypothetical protein